jgi:beta-glucosidase-like glycosyl hydrolase
MSTLNNRVPAVLKLIDLASKSGIPENATERRLDRSEYRQLLRQVASESIVLLTNDDQILPFSTSKRIAVIGPNAKVATYCGGGSASLKSTLSHHSKELKPKPSQALISLKSLWTPISATAGQTSLHGRR